MYTGKKRKTTLTRISKQAKEVIEQIAREQGKTETQVLDEAIKSYAIK